MEFRFYWSILTHFWVVPPVLNGLKKAAKDKENLNEEERRQAIYKAVNSIRKYSHISTRFYGRDNLPKDGGYIMYSNHQGKYDALGIILGTDFLFSIIMDDAKKNQMLTKQVMELCDGKGLVLNDPRSGLKVILEMAKEASEGRRFLIFPEGGYKNNHNRLQPFKAGAFKASVKSKTPIVPIALIDSYKGFNSMKLGWVRTEVHFLPPIPYEEYQGMNTQEIAEMVSSRIRDKVTEVLEKRWMNKFKKMIQSKKRY